MRVHTRFAAYLGNTTQARVDCLRGAIGKLQRGEIDIHPVPFGRDAGYCVWTCGVIIVAQMHNDTLVLIDVFETPEDSV
jgi:hypothetical protein